MKILTIGLINLRRLFRDRTNIFFVIVVPFLMIFVLGLMFGGGQRLKLAVTGGEGGPLADRLVTALSEGNIQVERVPSESELRTRVERGLAQAGVVIPAGYDAALRSGGTVQLHYMMRPNDLNALDVGTWVRSVVTQQAAQIRAARLAEQTGTRSFDDGLRAAGSVRVPGIDVNVTTTGRAAFPPGFSQFSLSAPPLMLLYIFLTSLTAAVGLVETRASGVASRMYSTPTTVWAIVAGETAGRLIVALTQGLLIMVGSALLFGVGWGDPLAAGALLTVFSVIGAGAAMVLASAFRSVGPVVALAAVLGLGLGALGGTMVPLESFSDTMKTIAHVTPHAWGYEAFAELVRHGGGIGDIMPQLGVLMGFAVVLFSAGVWMQRHAITR